MPTSNLYWTSTTQNIMTTSRLILDSTCPGNNCSFTYNDGPTSPMLTQISTSTALSGKDNVILTGGKLNLISSNLVRVVLQNKLTN